MADIPGIYSNPSADHGMFSGGSSPGDFSYSPLYQTGTEESTDAFNQIAPRPRNRRNFDTALKAEVHDPLFMIARQWQMGEFEFEDTGSAIFAKIAMDISKLSRIKTGGAAESYSDQIPLEARIERQPVKYSLKERVRLGDQWLRMLKNAGEAYNLTSPPDTFVFADYENHFLDMSGASHYSFDLVDEISLADESDHSIVLRKAKKLSQIKEVQYRKLISERKVDGIKIKDELSADSSFFNSIDGGTTTFPFITSVAEAFIIWVNEIYSVPGPVNDDCWDKESFNYNAQVSSPKVDQDGNPVNNRVLNVTDYSSDHLDWHAFDEREDVVGGDDMSNIDAGESVEPSDLVTMIPTPGSFPGMPAARWWEFEEGNVNIAGSDLSATDTVKSVLAEFALVYQDDWFLLPKVMPVGSTAKITGIVVKDVFGQHTLVKHTSEAPGIDDSAWSSWDMYSQSIANIGEGVDPSDDSLFLAPSTYDIMVSDALEEVIFIRDEMANMVFAVEKKIWSELGEGIDATDAASALKEFLLNRMPALTPITPDAELKYELGNTVPLNWIPFIPVHESATSNRSIKLQRASMPLILSDYQQLPIRPRTDFLRYGITALDELNGTGASCQYFIAEEVIPKAGIKLERKLQRARWFNGKTYLWISNTKTVGRGQGHSNLQYDRVLDSKTE